MEWILKLTWVREESSRVRLGSSAAIIVDAYSGALYGGKQSVETVASRPCSWIIYRESCAGFEADLLRYLTATGYNNLHK